MDQRCDLNLDRSMLINSYLEVKKWIIDCGFEKEVAWQDRTSIEELTETNFLREAAWVILCAGMREQVVREKFPEISKAFRQWRSAKVIVDNKTHCIESAMEVFRHPRKIAAIVGVAERVKGETFGGVIKQIRQAGITFLETFEYVGPVTKYHLAKNIGLDVVKPDRHLRRIAEVLGSSPERLCQEISTLTGDRISVVDIVLWRFATLVPEYETYFTGKVMLSASIFG